MQGRIQERAEAGRTQLQANGPRGGPTGAARACDAGALTRAQGQEADEARRASEAGRRQGAATVAVLPPSRLLGWCCSTLAVATASPRNRFWTVSRYRVRLAWYLLEAGGATRGGRLAFPLLLAHVPGPYVLAGHANGGFSPCCMPAPTPARWPGWS
jgi:hypothetical protein